MYKFLEEVILVEQPCLLELSINIDCCLRKVLYELKQVPQVWYWSIADFLSKLDLEQLDVDYCIFFFKDCQLSLALYVDDLLLFDSDKSCFKKILDQLSAGFKMINLGEICHNLGIKVDVETSM